jgi:hypothetical protein
MSNIFTQTSNKPYIRHNYRICYTNKKTKTVDNYQDVLQIWFQTPNEMLDYVEVLDYKEKAIGFK